MKTISRVFLVFGVVFLLTTGSAFAIPGPALQGVLNGITLAPIFGASSVDVTTDYVPDVLDSTWSITASGGSVATIIVEVAGFANENTFGVYDASDPNTMVQLFAGAATGGDQAVLSIKADGSVFVNLADSGVDFAANKFGYYLSTPQSNTFYSDTLLNSDNSDHMFAYQGKDVDTVQLPTLAPGVWSANEYALAWEDLAYPGTDADFNDFVVMVESVQPVPEPGSMAAFGAGLIGLFGILRRRFRR